MPRSTDPSTGAGLVPVPDPTLLSTQLVEKAILQLRELLQAETLALENLMNEKFSGRDKALDAALASAKETSLKSEQNVIKQIDNMSLLMTAQNNANSGQINDMKDRITTIESRGKGLSDGYGWLVAGLGLLVGGGGLIAFFAK